jgi:ParB family chromosome partitioning protein
MIPIGQVRESSLNPRRSFDETAMQELIASVKIHGVVTPVLVRPTGKTYELAAGHRRFRAAKAAGLTELPAVVRSMKDDEFLEVLTIENMQRADIHPLDEAHGYHNLIAKCGHDVERIAERVGRSVKYVYDRMKLLELIRPAQKLFLEDKISAGHAILLARLTPSEQERTIDPDTGGLFVGVLHFAREDNEEGPYAHVKAVTVRELQAHIDAHVRFDPNKADSILFPETVKELQAASELHDKIIPITHDHYVRPEAKDGSRTYGPSSWKRADGKHGSKACDGSVTGVIVVGEGRGQAFKVCVNKKKCTVHWGKEIRAAEKRSKEGPKTGETAQDRYRRDEEKRKAEEANQEAARARYAKAVPAILAALAKRIQALPMKPNGLMGETLMKEVRGWRHDTKLDQYVPIGSTADDLVRHAVFIIVAQNASDHWACEGFVTQGKAFGLDVKKIVDEAVPVETKEQPAKGTKSKKTKAA